MSVEARICKSTVSDVKADLVGIKVATSDKDTYAPVHLPALTEVDN